MAEKTKYVDRIMSRRGLSKFDTSLLSNDGGKYSPSIRRLRQQYLHDTKLFPGKNCSCSTQSSSINTEIGDSQQVLSHHQSSIDLMSTSLKCDDCQKNDGLFQCCHCNQRLCIRCCNKHYKKVTAELEHLHELSDHLLTKIIHIKTNLDQQKNETIEQCHKWRIDTINTINKAHTLIIQTIHDEYELLSKEYDLFVEKEMSYINIDKNELIQMKKRSLGSLLSSPTTSITTDSNKSMNTIKKRIETFTKHIDDLGKFSFQVKLPPFIIDDNLRVESNFGDSTRSASAAWQNDDYINDTSSTQPEEITKKVDPQTINNSSDTNNSTSHNSPHRTSFSPPDKNEDTYQNNQLKCDQEGLSIEIEQSQKNDGIINQRRTYLQACGVRRRTTDLPFRPSNTERLLNDYPWLYHRANSTPSFIQ